MSTPKALLAYLYLFLVSCGDTPQTAFIPTESDRSPECAPYFVFEFPREEALNEAVDEACFDHQLITGEDATYIEARLFAMVPVVWYRPGSDELFAIEPAGPTTRVAIALIDREVVYLAARRVLEFER